MTVASDKQLGSLSSPAPPATQTDAMLTDDGFQDVVPSSQAGSVSPGLPLTMQIASTSRPATRSTRSTRSSATPTGITGRKNHNWTPNEEVALVSVIYNNPAFQQTLLPSRTNPNEKSGPTLRKDVVLAEIARQVFPAQEKVDKTRIKSKLARLIERYHKIKKDFGLTGAGMLQTEMDPSNPAYMSLSQASKTYKWFDKLHEMMVGRYCADELPISLLTTPALDSDSDSEHDTVMRDSTSPITDDSEQGHASHARRLPNLLGMLPNADQALSPSPSPSNPAFASTPPRQSQGRLSQSSEHFSPTPSPGPSNMPAASQQTPSTSKRPRSSTDPKRDSLADAFYKSQVNTLQLRVQLEQEKTKRRLEKTRMKIEATKERKAREAQERMQVHNAYMEFVRMFTTHANVNPAAFAASVLVPANQPPPQAPSPSSESLGSRDEAA